VMLLWLSLVSGAMAERLKPFILADVQPGSLSAVVEQVSTKLRQAGFRIVGSYAPYGDAYVIAVTSPELLRIARKDHNAAWLAAMRVAATRVGGKVQVSYLNPAYFRHAYRIEPSLSAVADRLRDALGRHLAFGARRMTAKKLRRYHYAFGMEYFDDQVELADYDDHKQALRKVREQMRMHRGKVSQVYQVDIPGTKRTLIGVQIKKGDGADQLIMQRIDKSRYRHTAHLPYEILIDDGKVLALHPRFRIAIDFPDLKMSGQPSFFQIINSPTAIIQTLTEAVGGENSTEGSADFFRD